MVEVTIDCSDLAGTYTIDEAKDLVNIMNQRIIDAMNKQAHGEDNDLKFMGEMKKVKRHVNISRVYEYDMVSKILAKDVHVEVFDDGTRIVLNPIEGDALTFYPKSDKCQIHGTSRWVKGGFNYIVKTFNLK